jgi:hypothetical protein
MPNSSRKVRVPTWFGWPQGDEQQGGESQRDLVMDDRLG